MNELVVADDAAFKSLTDEGLAGVRPQGYSLAPQKPKSYINNIDVFSKQINSVNDRVIENNQCIIDA